MPRFTYLIVNCPDGEVKGTNDAEQLAYYLASDDYIVIVTTGDQSYLPGGDGPGEPITIKELPSALGGDPEDDPDDEP